MATGSEPTGTRNRLAILADDILALFPAIYRRHPVILGLILLALYIVIVMAVAVVQPQTDWDMLAYVAIAAEHRFETPEALHAYAYGVIRDSVSPAVFEGLTNNGGGYRSQMYADPAGFVSMLGMYRVKWLYCE